MKVVIKVPDIGIEKAEVIEILVHPNDEVKINQGLVIVEGQKASIEIPCLYNGIIKTIKVKIGDIVKFNSPIADLEILDKNLDKNFQDLDSKDQSLKYKKSTDHISLINKKNDKKNFSKIIHSSPSVKRLCRKLNISIVDIHGTGRKNRVLKEDVKNYFFSLKSNKKINSDIQDNLFDLKNKKEDPSLQKDEEIIFLSKIQKISGVRLTENWKQVPHVTQFDKIDITKLENFRIKVNENLSKKNIKLNLLPFIIKSISINLIKFKKFNSILYKKNDRILLKKNINIGIAVNTKKGIIVPVLKNVNKKTIVEISNELILLSKKAQKNKLSIQETTESGFTVSNLGGFGGMEFTPIINCPEVAILGVSRAKIEPFWKKNKFIPRLFLPVSLSYDHRVINGVDGAIFLKNLNENLSNFYEILF